MLRLGEELGKIISNNEFLRAGFEHRLFNLSQLAKLLQPVLERQLHKPVSHSSVLMGLSRLNQKTNTKKHTTPLKLPKNNGEEFIVLKNLFTATFLKTRLNQKELTQWKVWIHEHHSRLFTTEDDRTLTLTTHVSFLEEMSHKLSSKPKRISTNLSGILLTNPQSFHERTERLHRILWTMTLQGVEYRHLHIGENATLIIVKEKDLGKLIQ